MNFEKDLKYLIKSEYKSIRAFSNATDIPYSTIDNIFKRGIQGVSVQVVLKICKVLNIDVEKIFDDKLVLKSHNSTDDSFILYNSLDDTDKAEIRGEIKQMLKADKYTTNSASDGISDDIINELKQVSAPMGDVVQNIK